MKRQMFILSLLTVCAVSFSQSKDDYGQTSSSGTTKNATPGVSLLDPSRFTVNHMVSFGMGTSSGSSLQSQGMYSTMLQYKFTAPVTLNLNFSLPVYSTMNSAQNLTKDNIQSFEYFKNMPWDVSLSWKPAANLLMRFSIINENYDPYQRSLMYPQYDMFGDRVKFHESR